MSKTSQDVVITCATRTGIGKYNGMWNKVQAHDLGKLVIKDLLKQTAIDHNQIDQVILGQVLTSDVGQNPARQAAIGANIPNEKVSYIVNQVCGSGLRSVASAFQSIKSGDANIIVAGGQENMSLAPHALHLRDGKKLGDAKLVDTMIKDGLWDAFNDYHMGITAENVAEKYQINREDQDKMALSSQQKAAKSIANGRLSKEIISVEIPQRKGDAIIFDKDEHPRGTSLEKLSSLPSPFRQNGSITAGNASGVNDGAAAIIIASEAGLKRNHLTPKARIVSAASAGVEPAYMGIGPVPASLKALKIAGLEMSDMGVIEINEAFAAQGLASLRSLGIKDNDERVNPNGGAIALGHPLGMSGTRLVLTATQELIETNKKYALCTMCVGVGQGSAIIIERV